MIKVRSNVWKSIHLLGGEICLANKNEYMNALLSLVGLPRVVILEAQKQLISTVMESDLACSGSRQPLP